MRNLQNTSLMPLDTCQQQEIRGGNPILAAMGLVTSVIAFGKAVDKASEWFLEGWNNPQ